jgi:hypothetical protein
MSDAAGGDRAELRAPCDQSGNRRDRLAAALVALAVVTVVLWAPLTRAATHVHGSWDWLAQSNGLTRQAEAGAPENAALVDPVRQFVPWALLAREELAAGRAPLWNPFNGNGIPLLANYQSALLSPFTLPYYALPLKPALLVSEAAKLAVLAASMFYLLRGLQCSRLGSALGAVAYATSGFHLMCLQHPHVGLLALLPLALLAVERGACAVETGASPRRSLAALALVLGAMTLAGHPETLFFSVVLTAAYAVHRTAAAALSRRATPRALARFGAGALAAGTCALGLGAIQWLPFVEYLQHSAALALGERTSPHFAHPLWVLQVFPDLAGSPSGGGLHWRLVPNYQESNSLHVGALAIALGIGAAICAPRARGAPFFLAAAAACFLYVFDWLGAGRWLGPLFFQSLVPAPRTGPIFVLSACALAGLAFDRFVEARATIPRWRLAAVVALGVALLGGAHLAIPSFVRFVSGAAEEALPELPEAVRAHVRAQSLWFGLGLAGLAALAFARRGVARHVATAAVLAAAFAGSGLAFRGYVPTVEDRFLLPRTPAIEALRQVADGERVVFLTTQPLPTNANALYGIDLVGSYDALEIRELDELRAELFGYTGYWGGTAVASRRALELFGARYVATLGEWLPIDSEACDGRADSPLGRWYLQGELGFPRRPRFAELGRERASVRQTFAASRAGFDGLVVHVSDDPGAADLSLRAALVDAASGAELAREELRLGELRALPGNRREWVIECAPQPASAGRRYALEIALVDAPGGSIARICRVGGGRSGEEGGSERDVGSDDGGRFAAWALESGDERLTGRIVLDLSYARGDFEACGEIGGYLVWRYRASPGRAWLAERAVPAESSERALEIVLDRAFDPRREVVVEGLAAPSAAASTPSRSELVELERAPTRLRWRSRADAPAFLVATIPAFPGWRARIDGADAPLHRANFAFRAVEVPAGEHEVEFAYEPASFRAGAALSLASLLALAFVTGRTWRRGRPRS